MKQYYLKNGTRESGPYLLDDLKYQRISSASLVKVDGGNWEPITHNKDLRFLLATSDGKNGSGSSVVANPTRAQSIGTDADKAKAKGAVLIAIVLVIAAMGFAMFFFVNSASK